MPRTRYELRAEVELLSPLHVGSGGTRGVARVRGKQGDNEAPEVAAILRDVEGRPTISGATLKGLLRRIAERLTYPPDRLEGLLGSIKDDGVGRTGALAVFAATLTRPGSVADMPFADAAVPADGMGLGPGVYVAARTRIDRASGTAARNTLFHQEMVAPGARFAILLVLDRRAYAERDARDAIVSIVDDAEARARAALDDLLAVLGELTVREGHALGKGQADGQGRVRLVSSTLKVDRLRLDRTGTFARQQVRLDAGALGRPQGPKTLRQAVLSLVCPDPFLVLDSSYEKPKSDDSAPHLRGQRANGRALINGAGISGALRTRAAWLASLQAHRLVLMGEVSASTQVDDPDTPYERRAQPLSAVERLFGVTGFRGLLEIRAITVTAGQPWTVTSVKLDRLSGAPIDNALFATQAFVDTRLELTLALTERPGAMSDAPERHEIALFDRLVADIRANGLELGHGGNKGFGWFTVAE